MTREDPLAVLRRRIDAIDGRTEGVGPTAHADRTGSGETVGGDLP